MPLKYRIYIAFIAAFLLAAVLQTDALGQTYTYTLGTDCDGTWGDSDCWTVTANNDPDGCTGSTATPPPTEPTTSCNLNIIINDDLTYTPSSGTVTFGGNFDQITVGNGANFTINGHVNIATAKKITFFPVEEGTINIEGTLTLNAASNNPKTNFVVMGDTTSKVEVNAVILNKYSQIDVIEDADFIVRNSTQYNSSEIVINVGGFYRTASLSTQGGSTIALNGTGKGAVIIEQNVELAGQSTFHFSGESELDIGGNLTLNGGGNITAINSSKVFLCGELTKDSNKEVDLYDDAEYHEFTCRTLPVIWYDVTAGLDQKKGITEVVWSTSKEWETSHYEVERSMDGIENFQKIGEVPAMGWADTVSEYDFKDQNLPQYGKRAYYRIKQMDMDGTFEYSKTVSVALPEHIAVGNEKNWRAFPNPTVENRLSLDLQNRQNYGGEAVTVRLYIPSQSSHSLSTTVDQATEIKLDELIAQAPKGLLILEVNWGGQMERIKVIKQ